MQQFGRGIRCGLDASEQGPNACLEFRQREGLDQVVVGTGVQSGHAVRDSVARGEHEDGQLFQPFLTQCTAHAEPVESWQHDI